MVKLANPFYYPTAMFLGGVVLVVGVRFLGLSNLIVLPTAAVVTGVAATVLKGREPSEENLAKQDLEKEITGIKLVADSLADKAHLLREEANAILGKDANYFDLLVIVQGTCDRALELPLKVEQLCENLPHSSSLLSVEDLQNQLKDVQTKIKESSGIARQHLEELAGILSRNIQLARTGQDTRQAKIISLQKLLQESAGTLQELQNKLRTSDLNNSQALEELFVLGNELKNVQENVEFLIS
jgi:hypothetical protein